MATLLSKSFTLTNANTLALQAAVTGKSVHVTSLSFGISAATALPSFEDTAGSPVVLAGPYQGTGTVSLSGSRDTPVFKTATGTGLTFRLAGNGSVAGHITYFMSESP